MCTCLLNFFYNKETALHLNKSGFCLLHVGIDDSKMIYCNARSTYFVIRQTEIFTEATFIYNIYAYTSI